MKYDAFNPGKVWLDNNGRHINAHGAGAIFDGEKYSFTLFDDKANYLATKDVTVNNHLYHAGEVIRYEDKVNETNIASLATEDGGLCELPSQYDVQLNWLRHAVRSNQNVESAANVGSDIKGYGLYSPDHAGISNLLAASSVRFCISAISFALRARISLISTMGLLRFFCIIALFSFRRKGGEEKNISKNMFVFSLRGV